MPEKFYNVVKANTYIEDQDKRHAAELAAKDTQIKALQENVPAIEAIAEAQGKELEKSKSTILALEANVRDLTGAVQKSAAEVASANAKVAAIPAQVATAAAAQAVQISASQGIPPLKITSAENPLNPKSGKQTLTERCLEANRNQKAVSPKTSKMNFTEANEGNKEGINPSLLRSLHFKNLWPSQKS